MTENGEINIEVVLSRREEQLRKFTFKTKIRDGRDVAAVGSSLKMMVQLIVNRHLSEEEFRKIIDIFEEEEEFGKLGVVR